VESQSSTNLVNLPTAGDNRDRRRFGPERVSSPLASNGPHSQPIRDPPEAWMALTNEKGMLAIMFLGLNRCAVPGRSSRM
jgi:hypothetical protein